MCMHRKRRRAKERNNTLFYMLTLAVFREAAIFDISYRALSSAIMFRGEGDRKLILAQQELTYWY